MKTRAAREVGHKATHPKRRARANKSMRKKTSKRQQKTVQIPAAQAEVLAPNPMSFEIASDEAETGQENAVTVFEVMEFGVMESPNEGLIGDGSEVAPEESEKENETWTES